MAIEPCELGSIEANPGGFRRLDDVATGLLNGRTPNPGTHAVDGTDTDQDPLLHAQYWNTLVSCMEWCFHRSEIRFDICASHHSS